METLLKQSQSFYYINCFCFGFEFQKPNFYITAHGKKGETSADKRLFFREGLQVQMNLFMRQSLHLRAVAIRVFLKAKKGGSHNNNVTTMCKYC